MNIQKKNLITALCLGIISWARFFEEWRKLPLILFALSMIACGQSWREEMTGIAQRSGCAVKDQCSEENHNNSACLIQVQNHNNGSCEWVFYNPGEIPGVIKKELLP